MRQGYRKGRVGGPFLPETGDNGYAVKIVDHPTFCGSWKRGKRTRESAQERQDEFLRQQLILQTEGLHRQPKAPGRERWTMIWMKTEKIFPGKIRARKNQEEEAMGSSRKKITNWIGDDSGLEGKGRWGGRGQRKGDGLERLRKPVSICGRQLLVINCCERNPEGRDQ